MARVRATHPSRDGKGAPKDFNVPLVGGEQMCQALASLGVPTQLAIYPNSFHGITRPSYQKTA